MTLCKDRIDTSISGINLAVILGTSPRLGIMQIGATRACQFEQLPIRNVTKSSVRAAATKAEMASFLVSGSSLEPSNPTISSNCRI